LIRKLLPVGALSAGLALIGAVVGVASGTVPVSTEPSPYASCPNDGQPGQNFVSGETEPYVAVAGSNMIALWHQDRWSNGGAHGIGVGISNNGGASWSQTTFPDTMCSTTAPDPLAAFQRSSDPWVVFSSDGKRAYASALAFDATDNHNAVVAGTSTDGGHNWSVSIIPGSEFSKIDQSTDKNSTTADPNNPKVAYTVWDTLFTPTPHNPDDNVHPAAYSGPAYFSKTVDGGTTWSTARVIIASNERQQTIGNIILVDPRNGTLYDFTDLLVSPNTSLGQGTNANAEVAFVKSTDGGDHWTQPQIIAPFDSLGVFDPNTGAPLRVGNGLEEVAIDPATGKLYVTWERSSNFAKNTKQSSVFWDDQIVLDTSSDGGASWSGPTVIHTAGGEPTYTPMVAVNGSKVAVTYYDNARLQPGDKANLPTDYYASVSSDGGATFAPPIHLAGPFDEMSAPVARGFFLGDYEGLAPSGSGFEAVFVMTNCTSSDGGVTFTGKCGPAEYTGGPTTSGNDNPSDVFAASF
jgi:BNR repeat-like domain